MKDEGALIYNAGLLGIAVALIGSYILGFFGSSSESKGGGMRSLDVIIFRYLPILLLAIPGSVDSGSTTQFVGTKTYYPSFGIYPKDCRWRPVTEKGNSTFEYVW